MTQEDEQLLLVDLCGRLPYSPICHIVGENGAEIDDILTTSTINHFDVWVVEPYLRPLSSMTDEESAELSNIISKWFDKELFYLTEEPFLEYALSRINYSISPMLFDWLNKKMFDYRGLISKDLAISTEEFNPYND